MCLRRDSCSVDRSLALYGYTIPSISRQPRVEIDGLDSSDGPRIVTRRRYHINGNATSVHILTVKKAQFILPQPPPFVLIIFVKARALPSFCESFS